MARTDSSFSFAALMAVVAAIAIVGIFSISRGGETSTLSLFSGAEENAVGNAVDYPEECVDIIDGQVYDFPQHRASIRLNRIVQVHDEERVEFTIAGPEASSREYSYETGFTSSYGMWSTPRRKVSYRVTDIATGTTPRKATFCVRSSSYAPVVTGVQQGDVWRAGETKKFGVDFFGRPGSGSEFMICTEQSCSNEPLLRLVVDSRNVPFVVPCVPNQISACSALSVSYWDPDSNRYFVLDIEVGPAIAPPPTPTPTPPPAPGPNGVACSSAANCDDGVTCTRDRCLYPGSTRSRCSHSTISGCSGTTTPPTGGGNTPPPTPSIIVPRVFGGQNGPSMPVNGGMYGTDWTTRVTPGTTQGYYNCDTTTKCTGYTAANAGCFDLGYTFPSNPSWICANPTPEGAALYTCYAAHKDQEITAGTQTFCCRQTSTSPSTYGFVAGSCSAPYPPPAAPTCDSPSSCSGGYCSSGQCAVDGSTCVNTCWGPVQGGDTTRTTCGYYECTTTSGVTKQFCHPTQKPADCGATTTHAPVN